MPSSVSAYRFGPYQLRPRTRELYKSGIRVKLRPQPFRVLELLLEQGGDVVTREALRGTLWESETFVDFEQGLNTAVKELRAALSDSADLPRYIETVPRVGYRIVVPIEIAPLAESSRVSPELNAKPTESIPAEVPAGPAVGRSRFSWLWPVVTATVAILVFGVAAGWWRWQKRVGAQAARPRLMLAVLPFDNLTGDASQDYFSDGLTEEMISQLGQVDPQRLGVIARTSVMNYKQKPKPLDQVGRALGVEYVLEGSVRRDVNTVRVSAQLIQVKDQANLWSRQYDREPDNLLELQAEIAQEIADEIQLTLGDKPSKPVSRPVIAPVSYQVYDLCLKGRYFWNKRTESDLRQAAEYFQQAIDKDANYAPAYAGLADTLVLLSTWHYVPANDFMPRARRNALKALQIDDALAEAHASLALIAEQYDYDWQTAEREFRRAIQLDPSDATAHQWYAECLSFEGRFDEALVESERARQLDPLSLIIATDDSAILYYSRQYDRAIEELRTVREMQPNFPRSDLILSAYVENGDFGDALSELEKDGLSRHANTAQVLAAKTYLYGKWGRPAEAERWFAKFEVESRAYPPGADLAWLQLNAYMGVGRKGDALAVLEKCYREHIIFMPLKVDPIYDPLRSDPRFQELLRRTNLGQ